MLFHFGKIDIWKNISLDIKIGNTTISKINNYKYLGVPITVILIGLTILKY